MKEALVFYMAWSAAAKEYGSYYGDKRGFKRLCREYKSRGMSVKTITKTAYNVAVKAGERYVGRPIR